MFLYKSHFLLILKVAKTYCRTDYEILIFHSLRYNVLKIRNVILNTFNGILFLYINNCTFCCCPAVKYYISIKCKIKVSCTWKSFKITCKVLEIFRCLYINRAYYRSSFASYPYINLCIRLCLRSYCYSGETLGEICSLNTDKASWRCIYNCVSKSGYIDTILTENILSLYCHIRIKLIKLLYSCHCRSSLIYYSVFIYSKLINMGASVVAALAKYLWIHTSCMVCNIQLPIKFKYWMVIISTAT